MTLGLMTLASREPGRLNQRKADIFRAIAHQISIALQNAKLFAARKQAEEALRESEREARHLARENAVLAEIGRIISFDPEYRRGVRALCERNPKADPP